MVRPTKAGLDRYREGWCDRGVPEYKESMLAISGLDLGGKRDFTHRFAPGSITVVLGRNNAGKTGLARAIAGLEPSPPGTLAIDGVDVSADDARRRPVGLVYQAFVNYPNWNVFRNIASPLVALGVDGEAASCKVRDLARRLRIDGLLDRMPHELSGGQQQRVAIARALAKGSRVLVMDEPLVNLDYKLREELESQLRELLLNEGMVVVYTTSDSRDAFNLGDEVVLLDEHEKLQSGSPLEVYRAPVSIRAADLMSNPGVNRIDTGAALRPEHLFLNRRTPDNLCFEGRLDGVETSGAETWLHCRVQDRHWVARLPGMLHPPAGTSVKLYASTADLLRFDGAPHGTGTHGGH